MSKPIADATARKYDGTVARVAGNIVSGLANLVYSREQRGLRHEDKVMAQWAVEMAREIVRETRRTEPTVDALRVDDERGANSTASGSNDAVGAPSDAQVTLWLNAMETGATHDLRSKAFDDLRDYFFPMRQR